MNRRVVVTGLGAVTSLSCQVDDLWKRLVAGESGVKTVTRFDTTRFRSTIGGEITDLSIDGYFSRSDAKRMDRFAQFGLIAAIDAVNASGLDFAKEDPYRCGVIIGSGVGGLLEIEEQHQRLIEKGPQRVSAFTIPKLMVNAATGQVSIRYGLRGPNTAIATACASATNAIGDAYRAVKMGDAEVVITGGAEAALTPMGLSAFCALRGLSSRNDDPQRASRPFEAGRDGFILSEGAGVCVLEELDHALKRDANILAEMVGYGFTADGSHLTQPDENGTGAARAMSDAIESSGLSLDDIGYINAHGTSTQLGDKAETKAIRTVFGDLAKSVSVSSTKSQLGHLLGASGGVECVFIVKAIIEGVIPPTINYDTPDPECDLDYTPNEARDRKITAAMSNSFGFGGHNAAIVISKLR